MKRAGAFFILSILTFTSGANAGLLAVEKGAAGVKTRIVNCPKAGLGQIFIEDAPDRFMNEWNDDPKPIPAKGRVSVPATARLTLATGWGVDAGIANLRHLKANDLYALDVQGSLVTHENLKYICALKGLKKLVIAGCDIDDNDIARLATSLPALKELDLGSIPRMTDRSLENVSKIGTLEVLHIDNNYGLTTAGVEKLARARNLSSLNLSRTKIGTPAATLAAIAKLKSLKTLDLSKTNLDARGLKPLLSMASLRRLDLTKTGVDDASIKDVLGQMSSLEALNLSSTSVTDKGIAALDKLSNLRKLWLMHLKKVTNASVPQLAKHKRLENIEVQKSGIDSVGIQTLGRLLPKTAVHGKFPCHCRKRDRVNW